MPTHPSYTPAHGAQPLVSFIVPTYNLPVDMLRESLDSIMKGEYTRQGPDDFCELTPVLLTAANAQEFDINAK